MYNSTNSALVKLISGDGSANNSLITISLYHDDIAGQILALFILTIAAAESAIALALIMAYFKIYKDILFDY